MADLTHIFKVGQRVKCRMDEDIHDGVIKETFKDHVIIDVPDVSDGSVSEMAHLPSHRKMGKGKARKDGK